MITGSVSWQFLSRVLTNQLVFRLSHPPPPPCAQSITRTAGVVRTTGLVLDREEHDQHVLAVQVRSDRDGRVAHTLLHCTVMDVNDNRPVFVGQPYHAVVAVDASPGAPVTKVGVSARGGKGVQERGGGVVEEIWFVSCLCR